MTTATVSRWDRFRESFFWYSFKRDKVAIVSFAVLLLMVLAAVFAPLLAPADPYDLAQINIMNSELPPVGMSGADPAFPWAPTPRAGICCPPFFTVPGCP